MGPLVAERRIEIMDGFVSDAVSKGAELVGGSSIQEPGKLLRPNIASGCAGYGTNHDRRAVRPIAPTARFASL